MLNLSRYQASLSRPVCEIEADLKHYEMRIRKWQPAQNLVSRETLDNLWTRHFADSLQLLSHLKSTDREFVDLGSGGGFPALPLAVASKGTDKQFDLYEPNSRKVSFLRTVVRELGLAVTVHAQRAEAGDSRETADVITSRALAPLDQLCGRILPFFGPQTRAILHKGREHVEEIRQAVTFWDFNVIVVPSEADAAGVLLIISNLRAKTTG